MNFIHLLTILGILFIVLLLLKIKLRSLNKVSKYCLRPYLLTKAELNFAQVLHLALDEKSIICPKVRIADVLEPKPFTWPMFNAISAKHFDFIISDQNSKILYAIELDDSSHLKTERIIRDMIVDEACKDADFKLVRFKAKAYYSVKEINELLPKSNIC